ncbi:putative universal stress protein UspA [Bartonella australis AUST/NH1]|uniref:Putative universal stress protein UspA n=1 Tax=Bartonella australis (strain Aust/NH1) TaxID=1094489 RepID=M1N4U0_BARAA|nr:universal stress protein [Bartonella australis]AGF74909.1 putative universal stress protein UspA [Bartonella australis AUST/NH1]
MTLKRKKQKTDHRRKILVVIDGTPECRRAVAFAARHAQNTNATLVLLSVIDNSEFQHFLGVGDIMRAESTERASTILEQIADEVQATRALETEMIVREGKKIDEICELIDKDKKIALIVLAAGASAEGPGPLVQSIAHRGEAFPIPVTIIPSGLADEDIETFA